MEANVSTLLREFPKIRRAALSGEDVIVHTRDGDLLIQKAPKDGGKTILGAMKGKCRTLDDALDKHTLTEEEWGFSF